MVTAVEGVRIMCLRCEGKVNFEDEPEAGEKHLFISIRNIMNYPLEKGLELMSCKDETDQGEKVECLHKYDLCYKAWVECDTGKGEKEKVFFRGCGAAATLGRDVVDPILRRSIFDEGEPPVAYQHSEESSSIPLPNNHFPSLTGYMSKKGCRPNHTENQLVGKLHLCDRVHCNHGQILTPVFHLKIHLLWITLLVLK